MTPLEQLPQEIENADTSAKLVRAAAAIYGDDVAIDFTGDTVPSESKTFRELERESATLARGLLARGVGKGSRVGFISSNNPQFAVNLMGISRIGAVAVPISTLIMGKELVRVFRQSDISGLILQRSILGKDLVERVCDALPALREVRGDQLWLKEVPYLRWIVSTGADLPPGIGQLDTLAGAATAVSEEHLAEVESEVAPTDQMVEIYTSGSMAMPKGVRHNHGPTLYRSRYLGAMADLERGRDATVHMPMFWVGGLIMGLLPHWTWGARSIAAEKTAGSNNRTAIGTVLTKEDMERMAATQTVYWGLGMTETLGPYSYGDEFRLPERPSCAPMDHFAPRYDIRVADENGVPVKDGEVGEMQVRGYPVTPGLHKIERDQYFTPDGYYKTGDMCTVEGKRVHFVGRDGDMIKSASSNVSPAEVELELQSIAGVVNAYVVGIPDHDRGQLVVAAVTAREGVSLDFGEIEGELRKNLSSFKIPRAFVQIQQSEVPMVQTSNKVSRRDIEKLMIERLGRA